MIRETELRWQAPGTARAYATGRWSSRRRAQRDPRLVQRLLGRLGSDAPRAGALVLDLPCGTGRLLPALSAAETRVISADVSSAMLANHIDPGAPRLQARAERLPFASASFDLVVCCRLLHHVPDTEGLHAVVRELVRVSRGPLIASFWDARCLAEEGRRLRLRFGLGTLRPRGRVARARSELELAFRAAGAHITGYAASARFLSRQTFLLAQTDPGH